MDEQTVEVLRGLGQIMTTLNDTVNKHTLNQEGVVALVGYYDGDPTKCRTWLSRLDKYADGGGLNDEQRIKIALLTAEGSVEDFIRRWKVATRAPQQWVTLAADLLNHFGVITDANHAMDMLRNVSQKQGENVNIFAERIFKLSGDAYTATERADPGSYAMAQRQLVSYFTDGLRDKSIQLKIMRQMPDTLDAALKIARGEVNIMTRFELRTGRPFRENRVTDDRVIEPMEVNQVRPKTCHSCGKPGHTANNCHQFSHERRTISQRPAHQQLSRDQRMTSRNPVHAVEQKSACYTCGSPGHFARNCPQHDRRNYKNDRGHDRGQDRGQDYRSGRNQDDRRSYPSQQGQNRNYDSRLGQNRQPSQERNWRPVK